MKATEKTHQPSFRTHRNVMLNFYRRSFRVLTVYGFSMYVYVTLTQNLWPQLTVQGFALGLECRIRGVGVYSFACSSLCLLASSTEGRKKLAIPIIIAIRSCCHCSYRNNGTSASCDSANAAALLLPLLLVLILIRLMDKILHYPL